MTKKLCQLVLVVILIAGWAAWPATTAAQDDLIFFVTGVHTDNFPAIQVDLRGIDSSNQVVNNLEASSVTVTEAGSPVKDFKLTPNTDGAVHIVFVLDLDVYNSFSYSPSIPEMQAIFTTLAGPNYFKDGRDTVQVVGRINKGSDQTVELMPATHKAVDLVNWAQGFNFKGGTQSTNGLLGVDETIKAVVGDRNPGAETTAIIYVGRRIAALSSTVASSAATGYAQEAKDAHILLYAFHTGGQSDSAPALNTLANGSGGAYVRLQRGSVTTTVSGIYGAINAQRTQYALTYRSTLGTSGTREIKIAPASATADQAGAVTGSYDITLQTPVVMITSPQLGTRITRTPGGGPQKVIVTAEVSAWPDGHPRELKTGVLTVNGQTAGRLSQPGEGGIYNFEWDVSGVTQVGEHATTLQVTVTDELGLQGTATTTVGVAVEAPPEATVAPAGPAATATAEVCAETPGGCTGTGGQGGGGGLPGWAIGLIAGLGVLMVGAVAALVVVVTRMRRPAAAPAAAPAREESGGSETLLMEAARPQVTLAQIKILQGPPDMIGRTIDIAKPATVLGRALQGADIVFYADEERSVVSRRHCTLDTDGITFTITDHSANGTMVNGVRLQRDVPTQLEDGADVQLGAAEQLGVRFTFSNMIGKTQLWTPDAPGMARGGEGATMLMPDAAQVRSQAAARPSAARPSAAPPARARGKIQTWMIVVAVVAALVLLVACVVVIGLIVYFTRSSGQTSQLLDPAVMAARWLMMGL